VGISDRSALRLQAIYGLGNNLLWGNLGPDLIQSITNNTIITKSSFIKENALEDIQKQIEIMSNRGFKHICGYPVRGQRTRTNSRTALKRRAFLG